MDILVTGAAGQLGTDVLDEVLARGHTATGVDLADFDLTDFEQTLAYVKSVSPAAIVHCAAYTAVDKAQAQPALCAVVNHHGSDCLAQAAAAVGAKMLYVSTDYVFGGGGETPYETDAPKHPVNVYGETKLLGEQAVKTRCPRSFIVRTSWVFGHNGNNFVKTILRLCGEKECIPVVGDQIGSPTYTRDLAALLCDMIVTDRFGDYHATNEGFCSWSEFAREIVRQSGRDTEISDITTAAYGAPAPRPLNSRLSKASLDAAGFSRLPPWQDALARYLKDLAEK